MLGQHQDDVTRVQLQLVRPLGFVAVNYHHLQDTRGALQYFHRLHEKIYSLNLGSALQHPLAVLVKVTVFSAVHKSGSMNGED